MLFYFFINILPLLLWLAKEYPVCLFGSGVLWGSLLVRAHFWICYCYHMINWYIFDGDDKNLTSGALFRMMNWNVIMFSDWREITVFRSVMGSLFHYNLILYLMVTFQILQFITNLSCLIVTIRNYLFVWCSYHKMRLVSRYVRKKISPHPLHYDIFSHTFHEI